MNFLREKFDSRIPKTAYGKDHCKPFFGILFKVGELCYITQLTSPKPRHRTLRDALDFKKIYDPNGKLISCVNLNFMFPIPKDYLKTLAVSEINQIRSFSSEGEKNFYINLLNMELDFINNRTDICRQAQTLYNLKLTEPGSEISRRCLDFTQMERIALLYGTSCLSNK